MILAKIPPVTKHYDDPHQALMIWVILVLIIVVVNLLLRYITRNWL